MVTFNPLLHDGLNSIGCYNYTFEERDMADTPFDISEHFEIICQNIDRLNRIIKQVPPLAALAAAVPPTPKGSKAPIRHIEMVEQTGRAAIHLAAESYRDLYIHPSYSQQAARRTVGAIWYTPKQHPLIEGLASTIECINTAKSAIEQYVTETYTSRTERFEALRVDCPGVMTLHLYRKIRCLNNTNVKSVRFSWLRKDTIVMPVKSELVQRISEEIERSSADKRLPLEQLMQRVVAVPEYRLRIRRPVPVQPVANIRIGDRVQTVTAPMPLIIIQKEMPLLKGLASYDSTSAVQRKTRSDKVSVQNLGTFAGVSIEAFPEMDRG